MSVDRRSGITILFDAIGNPVKEFPSANNVTSTSNGKFPDGTWSFSHYNEHSESDATGPYGSNGIWVFDVPGRSGMGFHSGRSGPQSKTLGCIRTTDEATEFVKKYIETHNDPITSITVTQP